MNKKISMLLMFVLVVSVGFVFAAEGEQNTINLDSGEGNQTQIQERVQVQDGEHTGENGQMFKIQTQTNNMLKLEAGDVSADCECQMTQEKVGDKTKLFAQMSNGQNAEVKVMPDVASEKALERLKLKTCSEENECQIELKEVGSKKKAQMAYELQTQRQAKVLGMFKAQLKVTAQVSAEDGEIIRVKKQWWAFLASEPAEE